MCIHQKVSEKQEHTAHTVKWENLDEQSKEIQFKLNRKPREMNTHYMELEREREKKASAINEEWIQIKTQKSEAWGRGVDGGRGGRGGWERESEREREREREGEGGREGNGEQGGNRKIQSLEFKDAWFQ